MRFEDLVEMRKLIHDILEEKYIESGTCEQIFSDMYSYFIQKSNEPKVVYNTISSNMVTPVKA